MYMYVLKALDILIWIIISNRVNLNHLRHYYMFKKDTNRHMCICYMYKCMKQISTNT